MKKNTDTKAIGTNFTPAHSAAEDGRMEIFMKKRAWIILIAVAVILTACTSGIIYYFTAHLPRIREKEEQLREYNEFYARMLEEYAEENKLYASLEIDVAFIGDSLTAGYDVKSYYSEYSVTNRAIGGDTTHGLKDRLAVSVLDLKPKVCVMLIGGNNPDTMFEDYEDILIAFKEHMPETKIILVSHAPTNGPHWGARNEKFAYNNVKIKLLAEKYGYEFVDIYSPMLDLKTGQMDEKYTVDGAHFTSAGYEVFTAQLKPVIDKLLE